MPKVKDVMTTTVITIESNKTVAEATALMAENDVSNLIVMDNDTPIGIVTERDFVRRVLAKDKPSKTKISEIMSTPLKLIDPDAPLKEAARIMVRKRIRKLPVIKDNKLVGIITTNDFARHLGKKTFADGILEAIGRSNYPVPEVFEK
ncbi:MAG TPA: CBS domain-containing protein [Candidatus Bathyarchaeota archaeon]|nr:CBS domain-containing protein [Candidatus Bathyarchaeota archaeon]